MENILKKWNLFDDDLQFSYWHSGKSHKKEDFNEEYDGSILENLKKYTQNEYIMGWHQVHSTQVALIRAETQVPGKKKPNFTKEIFEGYWDETNPEKNPEILEEVETTPRQEFRKLSFAHKADTFTIVSHGVQNLELEQLHTEFGRTYLPDAGDGILSTVPGICPSVVVADCFPLYLSGCSPGNQNAIQNHSFCGTLHSGWAGTGILAVALTALEIRLAIAPEHIRFTIGPGICPDCYRVNEDRAQLVRKRFGDNWVSPVQGQGSYAHQPQYALDLWGINQHIGKVLGVGGGLNRPACTKENTDALWSYRAYTEGHQKTNGRMNAVCTWKETE